MGRKWGKVFCTVLTLSLLLCGCADSPAGSDNAKNDNETAQAEKGSEEKSTEETDTDKNANEETDAEADFTNGGNSESVETDDAQELENKLYNVYIDINNEMVDYFNTVIASYFDYVDFQEEFVLSQDDYWCMSNISTFYDDMETANELLEKKSEKDALDQAYAKLYPVMLKLAETIDAVAEYTDMKYYLDDDYAKGAEYHAIIWETYNQYEPLADQFMDELSIAADARSRAEMEMLKAEGYEATYALVKMISTAQEIQSAIYAQDIDDYNVLSLDIEALQPLYDQYVEEVQTVLDFMKDEDAMYAEGFAVTSSAYNMLEDSIKNAKIALTDLFERVKKQEQPEEYELDSEFATDGTIRNFDECVSDVIDKYNRLIGY